MLNILPNFVTTIIMGNTHSRRLDVYKGINNVVSKAPQNKDKILYRFCQDEDPKGMKVGDVVNFPYNLTCTNFDWNQAKYKNVYVITPLPNGKTRAHNLL